MNRKLFRWSEEPGSLWRKDRCSTWNSWLTFWCRSLSRVDGLFLALFAVKHITLCMFTTGSRLWAFLRWQIPKKLPFLCWKLGRGTVSSVLFQIYLFLSCFQWLRSVKSIMLAVKHSNANILSTVIHSLLIVKVLSTYTLFQEICGRESLDRALASHLHGFVSGNVMATIIACTGVSMG